MAALVARVKKAQKSHAFGPSRLVLQPALPHSSDSAVEVSTALRYYLLRSRQAAKLPWLLSRKTAKGQMNGGEAQSVQRLATGWKPGDRIQIGPGAHPTSSRWVPVLFLGGKAAGRGDDHPPLI